MVFVVLVMMIPMLFLIVVAMNSAVQLHDLPGTSPAPNHWNLPADRQHARHLSLPNPEREMWQLYLKDSFVHESKLHARRRLIFAMCASLYHPSHRWWGRFVVVGGGAFGYSLPLPSSSGNCLMPRRKVRWRYGCACCQTIVGDDVMVDTTISNLIATPKYYLLVGVWCNRNRLLDLAGRNRQ